MITSAVGILLLIFGISFSIMWLVNKSNNTVQTKPIEETKHTSTEVVEESQTSQPNQDPSLKEQEKKINDLMKSMSLEEKVGQLF